MARKVDDPEEVIEAILALAPEQPGKRRSMEVFTPALSAQLLDTAVGSRAEEMSAVLERIRSFPPDNELEECNGLTIRDLDWSRYKSEPGDTVQKLLDEYNLFNDEESKQ